MSQNHDIGKKIAKLRRTKKLSQNELAQRATLDHSTVFRVEKGEIKNPSLDTVKRLARGLGIRLADLVGKE